MVRDTKSKKEQTKKKAKEEQKKRMTTRGKKDDDESDDDTEEEEEEDMDPIEYQKLLASIFPSKNADKKVKDGEKLKKTLAKDLKKNKKIVEKTTKIN